LVLVSKASSFTVKSLVLEALTMIAPRTLVVCAVQVQRDASLGFNVKFVDGEHTRMAGKHILNQGCEAIVRSEKYVSIATFGFYLTRSKCFARAVHFIT
jgi:hypothetical protein